MTTIRRYHANVRNVTGCSTFTCRVSTIAEYDGYGEYDALGSTNALADLNADGLADMVSAAYNAVSKGRVVIVNGGATGTVSELDADALILQDGREAIDLGESIAHGDSDGDGTEDLFLSADGANFGAGSLGAVYVLPGPVEGERSLPDGTTRVTRTGGGYLGNSIAVSDADGDGRADLLAGEPTALGPAGYAVGAAALALGPFEGTVDLAFTPPFRYFLSDSALSFPGSSVALTDLDGDNLADVVIGAPQDDVATIDGGAIYLFYSSGWD